MRVLWYRDTKALNRITLAKVREGGHARICLLLLVLKHRRLLLGEVASWLESLGSHCSLVLCFTPCQITAAGSTVSEPYIVDAKWDFKAFVAPNTACGSW